MSGEDLARALPFAEEMALVARKVGDVFGLATALNNQAYIAWVAGEVERAETLWSETLEVARESSRELTAYAMSGLGDVALARDDLEDAAQRFRQALAIHDELGTLELLADNCTCLSAVAKSGGELERAARLLGAASSLRQSSGAAEQPDPAVKIYQDEVTAAAQSQLGADAFETAFTSGRARPDDVIAEELAQVQAP
jgi:ATP/maltotriose-dependent transcriptional regulator MalT